jgi:hypothetical protein
MANKTIYVRDADLPLLDAFDGESISAAFSAFLRERNQRMVPKEKEILQLLASIKEGKIEAEKEGLTVQVDQLKRAEVEATKIRDALRANDPRTARLLWFGARSHYSSANNGLRRYRTIVESVSRALRETDRTKT